MDHFAGGAAWQSATRASCARLLRGKDRPGSDGFDARERERHDDAAHARAGTASATKHPRYDAKTRGDLRARNESPARAGRHRRPARTRRNARAPDALHDERRGINRSDEGRSHVCQRSARARASSTGLFQRNAEAAGGRGRRCRDNRPRISAGRDRVGSVSAYPSSRQAMGIYARAAERREEINPVGAALRFQLADVPTSSKSQLQVPKGCEDRLDGVVRQLRCEQEQSRSQGRRHAGAIRPGRKCSTPAYC